MPPKRMLFVSWMAALGGIESSLSTRIKALMKTGVECEALFFKSGSGMSTFGDIPVYVTEDAKVFSQIVRDGRFDLVSLINTAHYLKALRKMNYQGKIVYEVRGMTSVLDKYCTQFTAGEIHAIVVPSRYVGGLVIQSLQGKAIPICVVPNATDTNLFHPIAEPDLDGIPVVPRGRPIILWVGRLDPNKNWREALGIVDLVLQRREDYDFLFVVDTSVASSDVEQFQQYLQSHDLAQRVTMVSCVPHRQMPHLYAAVARSGGCTLSTSLSEGLQNSLMEALACGCPVVSAAAGGNPEMVIDGETGLLYHSGEVEVAVACLEKTTQDRLFRQQVMTNGLARIQQHHTPSRHAQSFLQAIEDPWGYAGSGVSG